MKNSHLVLCQCWPLVTPGNETFTENWPQLSVFTSSVNDPRASTEDFSGNATLDAGRYYKNVEYNFLANDPAGISGTISVERCASNDFSSSTISPSVALCVTGT